MADPIRTMAPRWVVALVAACAWATTAAADEAPAPPRIVTLGFEATEHVFALGLGAQVVGVDSSSSFPTAAAKLPQVGYYRRVSPEGILSLRPTLVVASEGAGPPSALRQLQEAGVRVVRLREAATLEEAKQRIVSLGEHLARQDAARAHADALDATLAKAPTPKDPRPKVLFLFSPTPAVLHVAGSGTPAAELIAKAGGAPAMSFSGFRTASAEAVVAARPDLLLITERTLRSLGGEERLWEAPGLALTPAGKARRVVVLEDTLLLGLGPRSGDAVAALVEAFEAAAR